MITREMRVEGNQIRGIIDEIHFQPNQIIIIDDKRATQPFFSNKKQVWGYCLAFEEHFNPNLPLIACLRHSGTRKILWEQEFSAEDKEIVQDAIERIQGFMKGTRPAIPTKNPKKCQGCRLQKVCDKSAI